MKAKTIRVRLDYQTTRELETFAGVYRIRTSALSAMLLKAATEALKANDRRMELPLRLHVGVQKKTRRAAGCGTKRAS